MTKSRIIYIVVLALAVLVLIWDKSTSGPQSAEALPVSVPRRPISTVAPTASPVFLETGAPADAEAAPFNKQPSGSGMVQKLFGLLKDDSGTRPTCRTARNLFVASEEYLAATSPKNQEENPHQELIDFARQLELSGILIDARNSCAFINDKVLFLGDCIGPYQLLAVYPGSAVLQAKDEQVTLLFQKTSAQ